MDPETRAQIEFIAQREGETLSTYIFHLIRQHIDQYAHVARIKWDEDLNNI